ncbi:hypothetical protein M7I_1529 [Glarea lozoyensis 74030]|uniref:Uncharacterized protein n=1 Tax=Glarea lozoyensis (strain ATCC 74030 / MF5533) TaxID=1104152 RepID=H0EGB5_GLAL7|nr:hypothetical protein M7I_1529 [Glarea lozoyensis 74030]
MEEVLELVGGAENMRAVAYNFENLRPEPGTGLPIKGTVEFRQHAGSLDGPTITTWIQTVVGIVDFAHTIEPVPFNELLQTALANESWQMSYDGYDRQREETYGPILARERLTVIDLLRYMNLAGPASNYHARGLYFPFADSRPAPDGDRWKSEYQLAVEHGDRSHWRFENAMRDSCALGEEDSGSDFGDEWDGDVDSEDMSDEEVVEMRCAYIT